MIHRLRVLIVVALLATWSAACGAGRPSTGADSNRTDLTAAIGTELDGWYGSGDTGGAVAAVGLADGSVHIVATGEAAPGVAAKNDDMMRIGSITKTFIAALTLRLHDADVLDIDDPAADYLPDLTIDETVTIRSMLAHTSGAVDADGQLVVSLIRQDPTYRFGLADLVDMADVPDGTSPPTQGFVYANVGYQLMGGVIEGATGDDVVEALRAELFEPAGLTNTFLSGAEALPAPVVPGNVDLDGDGSEDSLVDFPTVAFDSLAWTAGALVSTPTDLIQFARALFDGSIIDDESLDQMLDTTGAGQTVGAGLGIFDINLDGATVYGNSGGGPGFHANLAHDPAMDTTAVIFTNCPSCAAGGTDTWPLLVNLLALADQGS